MNKQKRIVSTKTKDCQPYLLPHWQVKRAMLKPKLAKELTKPTLSTAFEGGFGIFPPTKNKINSCSVARSAWIDQIKY